MNSTKTIIAVSGTAGAGKNSVMKCLKDDSRFEVLVSYTTRPRRPGEIEGRDRHFLSDEEFQKRIKEGFFLEHEHVHVDWYGKSRADLENIIRNHKVAVVEIDVKGLDKLKKLLPDFQFLSFFIIAPSIEVALSRLKDRVTETEDEIKKRRSRYEMELAQKDNYDHVIVNNDLERAQREFQNIIRNAIFFEKAK
jgi:guanylate kinase